MCCLCAVYVLSPLSTAPSCLPFHPLPSIKQRVVWSFVNFSTSNRKNTSKSIPTKGVMLLYSNTQFTPKKHFRDRSDKTSWASEMMLWYNIFDKTSWYYPPSRELHARTSWHYPYNLYFRHAKSTWILSTLILNEKLGQHLDLPQTSWVNPVKWHSTHKKGAEDHNYP